MCPDKITSLAEYVTVVESLKWEGEVWFRGQGRPWPLRPKVFRNPYDENQLSQDFRLRAPVYGSTPESDRQDKWLFLAQHFGLPTRLLDWTASALVALFFAVYDAKNDSGEEGEPVVWALRPVSLNILARVFWGPKSRKVFIPRAAVANLTSETERKMAWRVWCEEYPPEPPETTRTAPLAVIPLTWVDPALQYFGMAFGSSPFLSVKSPPTTGM